MNFEFKLPKQGVLSPDDVHFFYYCVSIENEDCLNAIVDQYFNIVHYAKSMGVTIRFLKKIRNENVPQDTILMKENTSYCDSMALLRHLRNAFAHYRILRSGESFTLRDYSSKDLTMIGLVKAEKLENIVCKIIGIKEDFKDTVGEIQ